MRVELKPLDLCKKEWLKLISGHPEISYSQTACWANYMSRFNWFASVVLVYDDSKVIGGALIFSWKWKGVINIGYIPQGPIVNEYYRDELVEGVKVWVKKHNVCYLVWDISFRTPDFKYILEQKGFTIEKDKLPPYAIIKATSILDLTVDEKTLWEGLSKSRRDGVRKAKKLGLQFVKGKRSDLQAFYELMNETCSRRGINPYIKSLENYYWIWDAFAEEDGMSLYFIELGGELICASLNFILGDTFTCWGWGWSGKYGNKGVTQLFYWNLILLAKQEGFRYLDFVDVDADVALAIKNNVPMPKDLKLRKNYGSTVNKMTYGGDVVIYPGKYVYFRNRFYRLIGKCLSGILSTPFSTRLLKVVYTASK